MRKSFVWRVLSFICIVLWLPVAARAQNLFEADQDSNTIYEFTTNGAQTAFASLSVPAGLAFDNAGDLFAASGNDVYEFVNNHGTLNPTPVVFAVVSKRHSGWPITIRTFMRRIITAWQFMALRELSKFRPRARRAHLLPD